MNKHYKTTIFDTVFAVTEEPNKNEIHFIGTAFFIGRNIFATAGHVVKNLQKAKRPTLRKFSNDGDVLPIPILKSEEWGVVDFGLIEAKHNSNVISWLDARITEPSDVYSIGFAFGLDLIRKKFTMRHFKGHIVSTQKYSNWKELDPTRSKNDKYPFWIYELSFMCPKGQSGSPLLTVLPDKTTSIVGIVIGLSTSSIGSKITYKEKTSCNETVEQCEVHEYLHLGQAISTVSLLDGKSILLGNLNSNTVDETKKKTLREHIGNELVRRIII